MNKSIKRLSVVWWLVYILMFLFMLCIAFVDSVSATTIYKPLVNISNCYNLTVSVDLHNGVEVPIEFPGCSLVSTNEWFCKCFTTDNKVWELGMYTDNTILREKRDYRISIKGMVYDLKENEGNLRVNDWGDYTEVNDNGMDNYGEQDDIRVEYVDKFIQVNNTVYVDKIINNVTYVDKLIYVDRNITTYIENTTRIDELKKINQYRWYYSLGATIITILLTLLVVYLLYVNRVEEY